MRWSSSCDDGFRICISSARDAFLRDAVHTASLHTQGLRWEPFEVQSTLDIHRIAEEGVAAALKYKSGKPSSQDDDQRITWMRSSSSGRRSFRTGEFLSTLKSISLPSKSTPLRQKPRC